jgi:hypothetical protein
MGFQSMESMHLLATAGEVVLTPGVAVSLQKPSKPTSSFLFPQHMT